MTIREMIKQLIEYRDLDAQVVDSEGSPIMYMLYDNPRINDNVRLEPKSQMDVNEELSKLFEVATEEAWGDYETIDELVQRGFTLEDLKNYRKDTYEWAKRHGMEE